MFECNTRMHLVSYHTNCHSVLSRACSCSWGISGTNVKVVKECISSFPLPERTRNRTNSIPHVKRDPLIKSVP
ncbi:hypothetical protein M430DRAFT_179002 [Amorphotheca resinae ATCC 22711]|uniref:Uncharacterized protein n=1 Tax=Amorphotheca resinae ATCC 22711 TaxID=857342 RepID=A0A2T3ATJ0_AMORE|nr:hypothetical protein M430DRAFT_179002 [Amorphotheca resinae ATCC 22711]PSS10771.1 hypothetical protein M430DRAFT_179002 [Amorphotheca resinae ATCC 22711]